MATLQVETKAFPTSIPSTISYNQASPSSQFLSFRNSTSEVRGLETTDPSFSTLDKSSIQEGQSSNTGASHNATRVKAGSSTRREEPSSVYNRSPNRTRQSTGGHLAMTSKSEINPILLEKSDDLIKAEIQLQRQRAKQLVSRKRGPTDTKNGSRPRPRNGLQRARSISEILPLSTTRIRRQPIDWLGGEGGEDGVVDGQFLASVLDDRKNPSPASQPIGDTGRRYFNRETGFPRLPTKGPGGRGNSAITTRRQALRRPVGEDSDESVEKVPRDFPPPLAAANAQRFIPREAADYDSRLDEGRSDAFYRDTVPPPRDYYSRHDYWDDNYSPSLARHSGVYPISRAGPQPPPPQNWPGGPTGRRGPGPGPGPGGPPIILLSRGSDSESDTKSRKKKYSSTTLGWMNGKPIKKSAGKSTKKSSSGKRLSFSSTEGSQTSPPRSSEGIFQHNTPPVLTDLGRWQNRKANLWAELNPTISKDNTMGEAAQQAKMLAEFGKKNRHCIFGVRIEAHTSEEEDSYDSVDEPLDPPSPRGRLVLNPFLNHFLTSRPKLPSTHLPTSRLTDDSSSSDEYVTPNFESAGLEDEMKAWRLRGKGDHHDNDDLHQD